MKNLIIALLLVFSAGLINAQDSKTIILNPPDLTRGYPVMKALSVRASVNEYKPDDLILQDLSDLVWAANGINRPESGKRTAPSAMNSQDIDVYVVMRSGAYLYNPQKNCLEFVSAGDHRALVAGEQANFAVAPLFLVLVSDISRFTRAEDDVKLTWAALDAGIVSQNIAIFCAGVGLGTRPRAWMDSDLLRDALHLKESQHLMMNHPVGYLKN
jgi:SagB-type dehydrogenase family enzyme